MTSLPLTLSACTVLITLTVACVQDLRSRTVSRILWYPAFCIGGVCAAVYWAENLPKHPAVFLISLSAAALTAAFGFFGLFGKADAKALILISLAVPVSPFVSLIFPSAALSALFNAGIPVLGFAAVCLVFNLIRRNKAPFLLMCSGYPVRGPNLLSHHGFLAETVEEIGGVPTKTFLNPLEPVSALKSGSPSMIRILRENPDMYRDRIRLYARCDRIWITAGIPFLIPITTGFIGALCGISIPDAVLSFFL